MTTGVQHDDARSRVCTGLVGTDRENIFR